jgi:hypothetical protein
MNRRQFLSAAGTAAVTPLAVAPAAVAETAAPAPARHEISLNGTWERTVAGARAGTVEVPASLRPSGYYRLKRNFTLPKLKPTERAVLHFEAVLCHGRVFANGAELGTTIPYVPHEFDMTRQAREGSNTLEVAITDLGTDPSGAGGDETWLAVNAGWEGSGGLVRPAWVEIRPATYIDNLRLGYKLAAGYTSAACSATVFLSSNVARTGEVTVTLSRGGRVVAHAAKTVSAPAGDSETEVTFELSDPALWSPEQPNLYELAAALRTEAGEDEFRTSTGFREITIRGSYFELNGERIVLNGICRHDLWLDQGYTLTRAQMERDMRAIKALGANYVRLVHYPHDRYIVALANELGLMVSEEPGFWGMDFTTMPRSRAELGLKLVEKLVRRDWNAPAVFAWLLGNESEFTVEYLRQGKELCRKLDPLARPVSIANSMPAAKAKPICEQAGMDFFDDHPYTFNIAEFERIAAFYGQGKPLLFTEWGGRELGQSELIMPKTVDLLLKMAEKGTLAGHAFWSWQDLPQFTRIDMEMQDGILESGVVTENREPRQFVYAELARLYAGRWHVDLPVGEAPVATPLRHAPWTSRGRFTPVNLAALATSDRAAKAWTDLERRVEKYVGERFLLWKPQEIEIMGARFVMPQVDGWVHPIVLTPELPEVEIPVGLTATRLHFLGNVTCPDGFPIQGARGDAAGSYQVRYADGTSREVPLRAGIEVARANLIEAASRFDPVATHAQRAFWFVKDWAREHYQGLLFSLPVENRRIESVRWRLAGDQPMLLFALTAEQE